MHHILLNHIGRSYVYGILLQYRLIIRSLMNLSKYLKGSSPKNIKFFHNFLNLKSIYNCMTFFLQYIDHKRRCLEKMFMLLFSNGNVRGPGFVKLQKKMMKKYHKSNPSLLKRYDSFVWETEWNWNYYSLKCLLDCCGHHLI